MKEVNVNKSKKKEHTFESLYVGDLDRKLKELRSGISEDVAEILTPVVNRFFEITDGLDSRLTRVEGWLIGIGICSVVAIIIAIVL